jgi:DNA-binding HxlR family transcriptional regulator
VIARVETDERPARITYALTERGVALMPILEHLARWAADHLDCTTRTMEADTTADPLHSREPPG